MNEKEEIYTDVWVFDPLRGRPLMGMYKQVHLLASKDAVESVELIAVENTRRAIITLLKGGRIELRFVKPTFPSGSWPTKHVVKISTDTPKT